jgi:hypothetical protein
MFTESRPMFTESFRTANLESEAAAGNRLADQTAAQQPNSDTHVLQGLKRHPWSFMGNEPVPFSCWI